MGFSVLKWFSSSLQLIDLILSLDVTVASMLTLFGGGGVCVEYHEEPCTSQEFHIGYCVRFWWPSWWCHTLVLVGRLATLLLKFDTKHILFMPLCVFGERGSRNCQTWHQGMSRNHVVGLVKQGEWIQETLTCWTFCMGVVRLPNGTSLFLYCHFDLKAGLNLCSLVEGQGHTDPIPDLFPLFS